MNYYSPAPIRAIYDEVVRLQPGWHVALGGIMGNAAHFASGGYHVPRAAVPSSDYSVQLADDRMGDSQAASAIDFTPQGGTGQAVMRAMTENLRAACLARDPRVTACVREFAGTLNNSAVFSMDIRRNEVVYGFDSGHLTHVHISIIRRYANDPAALAGVASVIAGIAHHPSPIDPLEQIMSWYASKTEFETAVQHAAGLGVLDGAVDLTGNIINGKPANDATVHQLLKVLHEWTGTTAYRVAALEAKVAALAAAQKPAGA